MSVHLITGHKGEAHITANDWRATHRGIYGNGCYRLKDESDCEPTSTGGTSPVITFASGSFVWGGRHIRLSGDTAVSIPTEQSGTKTIYVYLHYYQDTVDNETIDDVEIVAKTTQETSVDNPPDTLTEAYRLIYTLTATYSNNSATLTSGSWNDCLFVSMDSRIANAYSSSLAQFEQKRDEMIDAIEDEGDSQIGRVDTAVQGIVNDRAQIEANRVAITGKASSSHNHTGTSSGGLYVKNSNNQTVTLVSELSNIRGLAWNVKTLFTGTIDSIKNTWTTHQLTHTAIYSDIKYIVVYYKVDTAQNNRKGALRSLIIPAELIEEDWLIQEFVQSEYGTSTSHDWRYSDDVRDSLISAYICFNKVNQGGNIKVSSVNIMDVSIVSYMVKITRIDAITTEV